MSDPGGYHSGVVSQAEFLPEFNLAMLSDRLRGFVMTVRAVSTNTQGQDVTGAELKTVVAEGYPPLQLFSKEFMAFPILYKALVEWINMHGGNMALVRGKPSSRILSKGLYEDAEDTAAAQQLLN